MKPKLNHTCPVCGGPNDCAAARENSLEVDCWCRSVEIGPAAIARTPEELRGESCLCPRCAAVTDPPLPPVLP